MDRLRVYWSVILSIGRRFTPSEVFYVQGTCDKVYISTSDVQMHANYHRKDSAIIQEGFQRLRATEECRTPYCAFYGQRTTHFHCRRDQCQFTFKNKADMGKELFFQRTFENNLREMKNICECITI